MIVLLCITINRNSLNIASAYGCFYHIIIDCSPTVSTGIWIINMIKANTYINRIRTIRDYTFHISVVPLTRGIAGVHRL